MPNITSKSAPSKPAERYVLTRQGEDIQGALFRDWAQNAYPTPEEEAAFDAAFDEAKVKTPDVKGHGGEPCWGWPGY